MNFASAKVKYISILVLCLLVNESIRDKKINYIKDTQSNIRLLNNDLFIVLDYALVEKFKIIKCKDNSFGILAKIRKSEGKINHSYVSIDNLHLLKTGIFNIIEFPKLHIDYYNSIDKNIYNLNPNYDCMIQFNKINNNIELNLTNCKFKSFRNNKEKTFSINLRCNSGINPII